MKILILVVTLIFSVSAFSNTSYLYGVDSYDLSHIMRSSTEAPTLDLLKDLTKLYDDRKEIRESSLKNFIAASKKRSVSFKSELSSLKSQMSPGSNGEKFVSDLMQLTDSALKENIKIVSQVKLKPKYLEYLKERINQTLALPESAQLPFWIGESELRNKIINDLKSLDSFSPSLSRKWSDPNLKIDAGIDDIKIFSKYMKQLPPLFGTPRQMTVGGKHVVIPLNLKLDPSCNKVRGEIHRYLSLVIMYDSIRMVSNVFKTPEVLNAILQHKDLTVRCDDVREGRQQTVIDSRNGHIDLDYYYYGGWCSDVCTRFNTARSIEVR